MKSLEEIKDEYAKEFGFDNWKSLLKKLNWAVYAQHDNDIVTKRFAKELAKQALINASESAKLDWQYFQFEDASPFIDKQSILNELNIPTL